MQIVINVPENTYRRALKDTLNIILSKEIIVDAIALPVGHGRLIDEDVTFAAIRDCNRDNDWIVELFDLEIPTILEVDGGDTE